MVNYVVRKEFISELEGDVFLSPFELLHLYLSFTIQPVKCSMRDLFAGKENDSKVIKLKNYLSQFTKGNKAVTKVQFKFNLLYSIDETVIDYGDNCDLGDYDIAPYFLTARFSN